MYKLLLSWRYLRTRYIALASVISVTLGVATLIVVNSVMAGFTQEMNHRLHGILSDLVFESHSLDGFSDPDWHMDQIRQTIGDQIQGMTAVVHVPALIRIPVRGQHHTRQINLIGVDRETYASVSDFSEYLLHPENQRELSFLLREDGYAPQRQDFPPAGWVHRRHRVSFERALEEQYKQIHQAQAAAKSPDSGPPSDPFRSAVPADPFSNGEAEGTVFDPAKEQHDGIILGIAVCSLRARDADGEARDYYLCQPGDDVEVIFPNAGNSPKPVNALFTVTDLYESKMSEYDSGFAFVPLERLQDLRAMFDPVTGVPAVTSIQIKLKPGADLLLAREQLRARFPAERYPYRIQTWRDLQGPLLSAVELETTILNILLFLIIAVAGFGILAIFFMIVVEKTRDIGVLKALGAPSGGVMSIFLSYGVSLGAVGSGAGMVLGLLFVTNINRVAQGIQRVTGHEVFDPTVYYFQEIPTRIDPFTIAWVVAGAVSIAVLASVLPALRRTAAPGRSTTLGIGPVKDQVTEIAGAGVSGRLGVGEARRRQQFTRRCRRGGATMDGFFGLASPTTDRSTAAQRRAESHETKIPEHSRNASAATPVANPVAAPVATLLESRQLFKSYKKGKLAVPVLLGVDFRVRQGEFVSIIGQSGSGKSTLLHVLGTLDAPDRGEVHYEGHRIDDLPASARDRHRNQACGMVFQFYHLLPELTALENVLVPLMIAEGPLRYWKNRKTNQDRARELLERVGLSHRSSHKPRELSGGEMQRAAIARALIAEPKLLLADEPTGNLDRKNGEEILKILRCLNVEQNLTIVMVTHDNSIACEADRLVRLAEGRVQSA